MSQLSQQLQESLRSNQELRGQVARLSDQQLRSGAEQTAQMQQQVAGLSNDLRVQGSKVDQLTQQLGEAARQNAELRAAIGMRSEESARTTANISSQVQQQVMGMATTMRDQDVKIASLGAALTESMHISNEFKEQAARMSMELQRAATERAATQVQLERLSHQISEGTSSSRLEVQRTAEQAQAAFREESRRQQGQYLAEISSLNREVEAYRQEATAAGAALRAAVDGLNSRLQSEQMALNQIRADHSNSSSNDAAAVAALRAQISELQSMSAGLRMQLVADQGMQKVEAAVSDLGCAH